MRLVSCVNIMITDRMNNPHRILEIVFALGFFLIARNAGAQQSFSGVTGGSVGASITFPAGEIDCVRGDPHDTGFWDFGPGATPSKVTTPGVYDGVISVHFPQVVVTYSAPGVKTFTYTIVSAGKSPTTTTYALHVFDCSEPSIPHDAIAINADTTITFDTQPLKTYWVNSGVKLNLMNLYGKYDNDSILTIFAEPGSTISGSVFNSVSYLKHGAVVTSRGNSSVIFGEGAIVNASSSDFTLSCPTLDFDYTNAPPNAAFPLTVAKNDLNAVSITLSPNPTSGMLHIQGLPSENVTVSVFNALGETAMVRRNRSAGEFTLDLSKLVPGTYYIRFASPTSVVTKMVVRE